MPTSPTLGRRASRARSSVSDATPTANTRNAKRKRDEEEGANRPKKAARTAEEILHQYDRAAIGQKMAEAVERHETAKKQVSVWMEEVKKEEACRNKLQHLFEINKEYGEFLNTKSVAEAQKKEADADLERQVQKCQDTKKRADVVIQEAEADMERFHREVDVNDWNEVFQVEGDEEEDLYSDN